MIQIINIAIGSEKKIARWKVFVEDIMFTLHKPTFYMIVLCSSYIISLCSKPQPISVPVWYREIVIANEIFKIRLMSLYNLTVTPTYFTSDQLVFIYKF